MTQTQLHNDNGLDLLLSVLNALQILCALPFAIHICVTYGAKVICASATGSHFSEIREFWPIRRATLDPVFVILYSSLFFYFFIKVCGSYCLQR